MVSESTEYASKRRSLLKGVGAAGLAGLAGCVGGNGDGNGNGNGSGNGNGNGNGNGSGNGGSGSEEPIKIGIETLLSGPFAIQGEPSRSAAELAVEQFNAEDGINGRPVELFVADSEASPETAVRRVREMHQEEDVSIIISQSGSAAGRAVSQYCADNDLINFAGGYSPDFTGADCQRTTFMPFPNLRHILGAHARGLAQVSDGTKIAGINPDYSYGNQSWQFFQDNFLELVDGAEVVAETNPEFGKGDYAAEISTVLDAEPDIVHSSLYAGDMISFIQQAQERGFFEEVPIFAPSGTYDPVASSLGDEMPEVFAGLPYFYTHPDTELNNQFASEFADYHGSPPSGNAHNVYSDMLVIKTAIEETGSTATDDLISAMEGMELEVPGGQLSIRPEDHQGIIETLPTGWGGRSTSGDHPYPPLEDIQAIPGADVAADPSNCTF